MKYLALLLGLTTFDAWAAPQLNIGSLYEYFDGNRSTSLKRIYNSGDTAAFVKVSVAELVYAADGTVTEVPLDGLPAEQRTLIASPARVIVPPNGMQQVRLRTGANARPNATFACVSFRSFRKPATASASPASKPSSTMRRCRPG